MQVRRLTHLRACAAVLLLGSLAGSPALGQTVGVTVPGQASPYLAGMPNGSRCCLGLDEDVAPEQSPAQVGLPITPGTVLTFSVAGSVSYLAGVPPSDPPDGGFIQASPVQFGDQPAPAPEANGIAGIIAPINSLVGVFLDDNVPVSSPAPGILNFTGNGVGTSFQALCPALKQPFYIGDGLHEQGTGTVQRFIVPAGATRLFLGTVDGHGWVSNSGQFSVNVTVNAPVAAFTDLVANGLSFRAGQTLVLNVHACNPPGAAQAVDLYVGALWPDGNTIAFLVGPNAFGGLGQFNAPASVAPMQVLNGGATVTTRMLEFTFPGDGIPVGTYYVFASVFWQGSLADNVLNDGDLVGLTFFPLEYSP